MIVGGPVTGGRGPRLPAPTASAARKHADRVDELMSWIGLPVWRFPAPRDHDAWAKRVSIRSSRHGRGQVHCRGNRAQHSGGMVDQVNKLSEGGLSHEIKGSANRRMHVLSASGLNEKETPRKMINHFLKAIVGPPLDGKVALPSRDKNPIGDVVAEHLRNHRRALTLFRRQDDLSPAFRRANVCSEDGIQMAAEAVKKVAGEAIALHDERIGSVNPLGIRGPVIKPGYAGMMEPEIRKGRSHIGDELAWVAAVEIP